MNPYCVPDTVLSVGNTVLKKTDMASALIQFIPRWFGRTEDDGINSEGCSSHRQNIWARPGRNNEILLGLGLEHEKSILVRKKNRKSW